jgi:hypothetical protein
MKRIENLIEWLLAMQIAICFLLIIILVARMSSCATPQPVIYEDSFEWGGMYTERDTIIDGDTLYFWEEER